MSGIRKNLLYCSKSFTKQMMFIFHMYLLQRVLKLAIFQWITVSGPRFRPPVCFESECPPRIEYWDSDTLKVMKETSQKHIQDTWWLHWDINFSYEYVNLTPAVPHLGISSIYSIKNDLMIRRNSVNCNLLLTVLLFLETYSHYWHTQMS